MLLKVLLGSADSLLETTSEMGNELCEPLLRVLFELWLRSQVRLTEMWEHLKVRPMNRYLYTD